MNTRTTVLFVSILTITCNAFGANPADLTVFDRFTDGVKPWRSYVKGIWETTGVTEFVALPAINNIGVSFQGWQSNETDAQKFIGRACTGLTPNIDATLLAEVSSKGNKSVVNNRFFLDLHGELFGLPAGFAVSVPFRDGENVKFGPRIGYKEFTFFTTVDEKGGYILGTTYCNKQGYKLELAWSNEETTYIRASKGFKTSIGLVCPEFRLNLFPDEQVYGVGLGIFW